MRRQVWIACRLGAGLTAVLLAALFSGCDREDRRFRELPVATSHEGTVRVGELQPGPKVPEVEVRGYGDNAYAIAEGQKLYQWFNCVGCHANGGGGIGPPLMDNKWIYGSAPQNIFDTIVAGRPNGMPSFRGKIPDYKVWQIVAYVRSLSSLTSSASTSPRSDSMSVTPPANLHSPQPPVSQAVEHP